MKCLLLQAKHTTPVWLSFSPSGTSGSQCCTCIPVCGHVNIIGRDMPEL
jgi:hypothetical protein